MATSSDDSTAKTTSRRRVLSAAVAVGAIAGTGAVSAGALQTEPSASVTFDDQETGGNSVTVQSITMSKGGFTAIHDSSLLEGNVIGSVIGVSEKLEAGTHEDVDVMLFEGVPGGDYDQDMLMNDQTLIAMPHLDTNDNGTYDFITSNGEKDGPYVMDGSAVVDSACITVCE